MCSERTLFDSSDLTAEAAADARADADAAAGRVVSHEAVKRWVDEAVAHLEAIIAYISAFNPGTGAIVYGLSLQLRT